MNEKQFIKKYCHNCGSQRCEGIGTDWFEGCQYKWNLNGQGPAAEIARLNLRVHNLVDELLNLRKENDILIKDIFKMARKYLELDDKMPEIFEEYKAYLLNQYERGNTDAAENS